VAAGGALPAGVPEAWRLDPVASPPLSWSWLLIAAGAVLGTTDGAYLYRPNVFGAGNIHPLKNGLVTNPLLKMTSACISSAPRLHRR